MDHMKRPNIVLVTTDQQRFDAAGSAAPSFLRTPHIDLLESEGVTFSSAYSDCPICVPARTTIMTGRSALQHGLFRNGKTSQVMGAEDTLPALLGGLGYQTVAIGKMHFGPQRVRHGFDEMILPDDYYRWIERSGFPYQPMRHGLGQLELYPAKATVPESLTLTTWTADRCADFILHRRDPSVPFFLWCSFSKPHPPLDPPEPYYSMYLDAPIPGPTASDWSQGERCPPVFRRVAERRRIDSMDARTLKHARAAYYGLVTHIDYAMGRVFAALQESGEWGNTLILYTSDHGEFLGDHGNGGKIFFHEPSAHIPFILRPPKEWALEAKERDGGRRIPAEGVGDKPQPGSEVGGVGAWAQLPERVETPVSLADVLPTLVSAAGGAVPEWCEGMDLYRACISGAMREATWGEGAGSGTSTEGSDAGSGIRYIVGTGAFQSDCDYLAVTDGRWKYIYYPEGPVEQLFDLARDPGETRDLIPDLSTDPGEGTPTYGEGMDLGQTAGEGSEDIPLRRLREALRARVCEVRPDLLPDGNHPVREAREISRTENRRNALYSFHTERFDGDVRH